MSAQHIVLRFRFEFRGEERRFCVCMVESEGTADVCFQEYKVNRVRSW